MTVGVTPIFQQMTKHIRMDFRDSTSSAVNTNSQQIEGCYLSSMNKKHVIGSVPSAKYMRL